MKEITGVLNTVNASRPERARAQREFLKRRRQIWERIHEEKFPTAYVSGGGRKFVGAPARTAIRCDFLLASKMTLGARYNKDRISDLAQRDLLFRVLRYREVFPNRSGKKFYCCPRCTGKLYECVSARTFHYIDNAKWKAEMEVSEF